MKTQWYSAQSLPGSGEQRRDSSDDDNDDERKYRHKEAGWLNNCCCCSCPALGFIVGLLVCAAAIGPVLTILLMKPGQTISTTKASDVIYTESSVASAAPITIVPSIAVSTISTSSSTTITSSSTRTSSTSMSSTTTTSTITSTTTTAPYCLTRITFDDIPGQSPTSGVIPNGYNNLNWTNVRYLNASTTPLSGYQIVVNSPPFIAYNPGGVNVTITSANGTRFSFDSVIVSPAWRNNLIWTIYGYQAGILQLSGSLTISVINQTTITCGVCSGFDRIVMTTSGGTPYVGLVQNGTEFGFDDLCISFGY